jgi:hypothetical protein
MPIFFDRNAVIRVEALIPKASTLGIIEERRYLFFIALNNLSGVMGILIILAPVAS